MEFTFKSKFNLEDVVWFMHENRPAKVLIQGMNIKIYSTK